mmetsp:Transcript_24376/g.39255  ORF Transcript_24376/g.39255 Transcript_24376/m.39255 type:complete len:327 (+) Transcript_24376:22-1002(+)
MTSQKAFNVNEMDFTEETKKQLLQAHQHSEQQLALHSHPILPDDVDEFGNLPHLRCGWTKCGQTFDSRDALMRHIKECIPNVFVDNLHKNCKNILVSQPELSLDEFCKLVKECYDAKTAHYIHHNELSAYYHHFQPLFKAHQHSTGDDKMTSAEKEKAEILFNYRNIAEKELVKEREKHVGLPDVYTDSYGHLPRLRCAWSKCARVFDSKTALLQHVKECIPVTYVERFHTNCKVILETDPDLELSEFVRRVKDCYDKETQANIDEEEIKQYFRVFQPMFKKHKVAKAPARMSKGQKETAEILMNCRIQSQKKLIETKQIPEEFPQ